MRGRWLVNVSTTFVAARGGGIFGRCTTPTLSCRISPLVLCVAAVTTVLFHRLRQPVVFGYLLAGMIVGPYVPLPLAADENIIRTLSELGVILLMFSLGLEFSIRRVAKLATTSGLGALAETSLMFGLGYVAAGALGLEPLERVFAGAMVAISSTTIIANAFAERGVRGRVRDTVFGILIIEDLIAILLVATLTAVAAGGGLSPAAFAHDRRAARHVPGRAHHDRVAGRAEDDPRRGRGEIATR
jgi:CPA2 family monovalent cation:H+ antiporter-2